jgi:hypothetical protein
MRKDALRMTVRSVPASTAPILEELELEQPTLVTAALLGALAARRDIDVPIDELVERLRHRGWLLDLKTRGVWEFAPAARAGSIGSGDPFIELRATLLRRPDLPAVVAAESAAWLQGLSGRPPSRHAIAVPAKLELPPALGAFRAVRHPAQLQAEVIDGLPTWRVESLLVLMAAKPGLYRDWRNVAEWLAEAMERIDDDRFREELVGRRRSTWARTAYLAARGGRGELAQELIGTAPPGTGPYYLGPRDRSGQYDSRFDVIDSYLPGSWASPDFQP